MKRVRNYENRSLYVTKLYTMKNYLSKKRGWRMDEDVFYIYSLKPLSDFEIHGRYDKRLGNMGSVWAKNAWNQSQVEEPKQERKIIYTVQIQ
jgi:hypothetical protein